MRNEKGFTLIELMVVVVIIGILSAIAIPRFIGAARRARVKACVADVTLVREALGMFITDYGFYPDVDYDGLKDTLHAPGDTVPYVTLPYKGHTFDENVYYGQGTSIWEYDITAPVKGSPGDTVWAKEDSLWTSYD